VLKHRAAADEARRRTPRIKRRWRNVSGGRVKLGGKQKHQARGAARGHRSSPGGAAAGGSAAGGCANGAPSTYLGIAS